MLYFRKDWVKSNIENYMKPPAVNLLYVLNDEFTQPGTVDYINEHINILPRTYHVLYIY